MVISFIDLLLALLWPLITSAAAWIIAARALSEADEISAVVQALTRSNAAENGSPLGKKKRPLLPLLHPLFVGVGRNSTDIQAREETP